MISLALVSILFFMFAGCAPKPQILSEKLPQTYLLPSEYEQLQSWAEEDFDALLPIFEKSCISGRTKGLYGDLCDEVGEVDDARAFFEHSLRPYKITTKEGEAEGLITGYYEPLLLGSLQKSERYRYLLYAVPDDLIIVKLDSLYPKLKGIRLRGRLEGNTLVPYAARKTMAESNASVLCWVDDKVSLFFLEVQGSGRIELDDGETIFVGYANQNGHPYRSIGKYLIEQNEISREEVSLQSIRAWLADNPQRVDEVLNANPSRVFFQERRQSATGSLGLELTPERSIAVDRRYVPLGAMLYMQTQDPIDQSPIEKMVFAQDTGGAIKGEIRADMFWGYGSQAESKAGKMQEPLELWILLPRNGE